MSANKKRAYLLLVFSASFLSVLWTLSVHNAFVYDDSTLLSHASLLSYDQLFSFYPSSVYLDRPVRDIINKVLFDLFEDDYFLHHVALVLTHLLNTLLAFMVVRRVFALQFDRDPDKCYLGASIAAVVFGAWPNSLMAVQWVSGSNDLMGTTFALLACLFYLRARQESCFRGQNTLLLLFFYYLSIRTKEMFYPLPLIFVLCETFEMLNKKKKSRISAESLLCLALMVVFMAGILYYKAKDGILTVDPSAPYYQSFNPFSMAMVLMKYCMMYFDLTNGGFVFEPSVWGTIGLSVALLGLLAAMLLAMRSRYGLLTCYVSILISIVMVLPMVNQIHRLYLYMPAFFCGMTVACAICALPRHQEKLFILICICCVLAGNASGPRSMRSGWYAVGDMENHAYNQLKDISKPISDSNVYILLDDVNEYNPFYYGPGSIVELAYQDNTLRPSLHSMNETIEYEVPYIVLRYSNGTVTEVMRDGNRVLRIVDVYHYLQEDGSLLLGVVPEEINPSLQVFVNGEAQYTVIGEDFISAKVDQNRLEGKSGVRIAIVDAYGTVSDPWDIAFK